MAEAWQWDHKRTTLSPALHLEEEHDDGEHEELRYVSTCAMSAPPTLDVLGSPFPVVDTNSPLFTTLLLLLKTLSCLRACVQDCAPCYSDVRTSPSVAAQVVDCGTCIPWWAASRG